MPDPPSFDDLDHLRDAIERLTHQVDLLTRAIDDLSTEIQWRNNQFTHDEVPPPLQLTTMPVDPTASTWRINEACPPDPKTHDRPRTQKPLFD